MKCKDNVTVIFLFSLLISSTASRICDYSKVEGESVTIKLSESHKNVEEIKWKHVTDLSQSLVGRRKNGQNMINKGEVKEDGSLIVKEVNLDSSGNYTVEMYDDSGKHIFKTKKVLCVHERLSKPDINFTCMENGRLKLMCAYSSKKPITYTWLKNGKHIQGITETTEQENGRYICKVNNSMHSNISEEITTHCPIDKEDRLFGFDLWMMVAILAGGGGLVLLLIIVLVICACQSCKRREKHQRDEEEFRLNLHNPAFYDEERSKQTARGQPAPPVPEESDDYSNDTTPALPQNHTKTKGTSRGRPPPPPIDDDEDPPPLPQPRKKAPRAKASEAPMYMQP